MSHRALQQVVVRLLHDPAFVDALRADPEKTLADEALSTEERAWLAAVDPRAWRADPLRGDRLVTAMIEEFPAATCLACRTASGIERLRAFVRSRAFHACIDERGSLAASFHRHLDGTFAGAREAPVRAFAALEAAIARIRRAPRPPTAMQAAPDDRVALSPLVALVTVPNGTLASYQAMTAAMTERAGDRDIATVVLDPGWRPPAPVPGSEADRELLLVDGTAATPGGIGIAPVGDALAELLTTAAGGTGRAALVGRAVELGAEPAEAPGIMADLLADRVIVPEAAVLARAPRKPYGEASIEGPPS